MPTQPLYLFYDEWPADLCHLNYMYGAIISHPEINETTLKSSNHVIDLRWLKLCTGFISNTSTIHSYFVANKVYLAGKKSTSGKNCLWYGLFCYCIASFLTKYYKYCQPPPIIILYDAKSLSQDLKKDLYTFVEERLNEIQKPFTGYDIIIELKEGHKGQTGIDIADKTVRETDIVYNKLMIGSEKYPEDLTRYLEEITRRNPEIFSSNRLKGAVLL